MYVSLYNVKDTSSNAAQNSFQETKFPFWKKKKFSPASTGLEPSLSCYVPLIGSRTL